MVRKVSLASLCCLVALVNGRAHADSIFTVQFIADFEFELVDGPLTMVTGLPAGTVIPLQARGPITFSIDDSIPNAMTIPITGATGVLPGVSPQAFLPFQISPNVGFVGGQLTDVMRDISGEITSANVDDLRMFWEMTGNPVLLGGAPTRLHGNMSLDFNGSVGGIPFAIGDVIAGPDPFNVYLDIGLGAGTGDPLVAIGRNRTLAVTAIPEPGAMAIWCVVLAMFAIRPVYLLQKQMTGNLSRD